MSQIITVTFAEGQREAIAAQPLEQWAYGQTLQFAGLDLPQAYRVDFSNFEYCGASIPRVGGPDGVAVPVEVLTSGRNVYAFIWVQDETSGARYRRATVRVVPGPEPDTDESPEEQSAVTEAINALNAAAEAIPAEIQAAMEEAKQSGEYDGNRIWYSTIVPDKISSTISQLAFSQLSGVPDATPQIGDLVVAPEPKYYPTPQPITGTPTYLLVISDTPAGHQLARLTSVGSLRGAQGDPGDDGVSPSVSVSEITGGHRVSITDAQGTETFDVMDGLDGPSGGQFWTAQSASTSPDYTWSFSNLIGPDDETPAVGDIIFYSIYRYTVAFVDLQNQKVTCTARTSLRGPQGPAGQGVPVGGDQAQILSKKSATDYDTQWSDIIDLLPSTFKAALLQLAQKVAYIDDQGSDYYQDLYDALYPPKELVSISAVFTQGQTVVYDTDSLDSLKTMLVVTGTYDDQSTETIPSTGYTLSGTLSAGTSTITVTCDGKTTTFTVQVTHQPGVYAVTNNLTGCSNSNTAVSVTEGSAYAAQITAGTGYTLVGAVVTITMGGQDITASAYSGGVISIPAVTGALVISVAAAAVVLSSITAVYTQSGTVYDTDSLDSLKSDLVVTANYSDTTTATVASTDYTLSGTLTAGTSTVTVAYHGKTTTFTVTVTHRVVPSGYTAYDYVKYTGTSYSDSATPMAFVLTTKQFTDVNSLILDFDVMPAVAQTGGAAGILGCQSDSGNENTVAFYGRTDTQRISAFTKGAAVGIDNIPNMQVNKKVHVRLNPGTQSPSTLSADSLTQTVAWSTYNAINAKIGYFGNARISYSKITIKPFAALGTLRIYDLSENLIGEYVPCVRDSDSVIGVYDNVENVFHTASTAAYATVGNENCVYAVGSWEA